MFDNEVILILDEEIDIKKYFINCSKIFITAPVVGKFS